MILGTLLVIAILIAAQGIYRNWDVYRGRATEYDALPEHLNTQAKIDAAFPDDSQFANRKGLIGFYGRTLKKFNKLTKPWSAFGPHSRFSWARWGFPPREIFKIGGKGTWRYEDVPNFGPAPTSQSFRVLSRCQYYKRWHFAWLSPLCLTFHMYWRASDMPVEGTKWKNEFDITRLLFVYGPMHWDADLVYWILSFYIGGQWK